MASSKARKRAWTKYNRSKKKKLANERYRKSHKEQCGKWSSDWQKNNRDRRNKTTKKWRKTSRGHTLMLAATRRSNAKLKKRIIEKYGGECACCGETEIVFLTIDHIKNDGAERRRKGELCGQKLYRWLRPRKRMKRFQVLCWNCNTGKYHNGGICPHQRPKMT